MNITRVSAGEAAGPGPGPSWWHQPHGFDVDTSPPFHAGIFSRFLYNFCTAISTCGYILCCCWLLQNCFGGQRDHHLGPPPSAPPNPSHGPWTPAPPEPPLEMPRPPGVPAPPGPPGAPVERLFL